MKYKVKLTIYPHSDDIVVEADGFVEQDGSLFFKKEKELTPVAVFSKGSWLFVREG